MKTTDEIRRIADRLEEAETEEVRIGLLTALWLVVVEELGLETAPQRIDKEADDE